MAFSISRVTKCRISSLPNFQSTYFGSFWSQNSYPISNNFGSGLKCKLLESNNIESSREGVNRTRILPIVTTKIGKGIRDAYSSKPFNFRSEFLDRNVANGISKSGLSCFKSIQFCDAPQKIKESQELKHLVTVLVIDVETTGLGRESGRIIEIAVRDLLGGKNSCFHTLVNPEQYVPNSHIHGITSHMVNQPDVPRMEDLIPILIEYIEGRQIPGGLVLFVAHNARRFDVPFLSKEFCRCSYEIPPNWLFMDTLPLARELMRLNGSKLSSVSLQALRKYYKIPLEGSSHRAMSDVNILSSVLERMTFDMKLTVADYLKRSFKASDPINLQKKKEKSRS